MFRKIGLMSPLPEHFPGKKKKYYEKTSGRGPPVIYIIPFYENKFQPSIVPLINKWTIVVN